MSPLGFILLLGLTTPQNQAVAIQQNSLPAGQSTATGEQLKQLAESATHGNVGCYTIRSYIFAREDGNAPVLIGTTTCTPANANRTERVGRPPKAKLVPM